uniref:DNA polymerase alpha subunit B n=1 Tax=Trypanosoma congolense (strain IL3000) TaxID=1068625 RepID=G0V2X6_TRYCI|nr:unnamed protein product [Trypanosoma congolense IL3000]
MQNPSRWKAAANLELLLGNHHPPACISKGNAQASLSSRGSFVEARNSVGFRDTMYCNRQDCGHAGTRRRLAEYYRYMISKIDLWERGAEEVIVKKEEEDEGGLHGVEKSSQDGADSVKQEVCEEITYRASGILTEVCSPAALKDELLLPWEFFPITDADNNDAYLGPIRALTKEVTPVGGYLQFENHEGEDGAAAGTNSEAVMDNTASHTQRSYGASRISLYTRMVPQFTGIYPGMVVGVVGVPFKRSSSGVLTAVLVRRFILPSLPEFPWGIGKLLNQTPSSSPLPTRIHFCSGPFPRRETYSILSSVTWSALCRGANLLVIGGPLVREFEDFEKDSMKLVQFTFEETLSSYIDTIEETLNKYYEANDNPHAHHRMKVVLVPHRDDVTQIPALPITMYSLESAEDVWVRSNPCRISVNGVHVGVCNEDVVGDMRDRMVERWPAETGSLRRVVEAIVRSRLYAPLYEFPAAKHDLQHLHALRLDYRPGSSPAVLEDEEEVSEPMLSWDALEHLRTLDNMMQETNLAKKEEEMQETDQISYVGNPDNQNNAIEWMPHLLFLPSTRPRFAFVSHRRGEVALDDVATASGVMVVNQEIWSRRVGPRFELRVAEVTINDSERVVRHGASEANGVVCGLLHFTNSGGSA